MNKRLKKKRNKQRTELMLTQMSPIMNVTMRQFVNGMRLSEIMYELRCSYKGRYVYKRNIMRAFKSSKNERDGIMYRIYEYRSYYPHAHLIAKPIEEGVNEQTTEEEKK